MKKKESPYYLLIHTDSYTGNFDRELVAYSVGILDEIQKDYANEYKQAFWNNCIATDINSYEEYKANEESGEKIVSDGLHNALMEIDEMLKKLDEEKYNQVMEKFRKKEEKSKKERYEKDVCRLYDTYLCYTYQTVDDWEQNTFYNIESFYKNETYNCDTIFIQLKSPLPEHLERIVIERIKQFFETEAYNIIEDYTWLCHFGERRNRKKEYHLLDLELVDKDYNLIKKYV